MLLARARIVRGEREGSRGVADEARASLAGLANRLSRARAIPKAKLDALAEARELTGQAQHAAQRMREAAEREAAEIREQARREGELRACLELVDVQAQRSLGDRRTDELQQERWYALARLVAERLVGETLTTAPERLCGIVTAALDRIHGARIVRIFAHPSDALVLRAHLAPPPGACHTLEIVDDEMQLRACVRIESDAGTLHADIPQQLDRLFEALRSASNP